MLSYFMAILDSLINWMINTSKAVFLHCLQIIIIITTSVQNFTMSLFLHNSPDIYNILFRYMDGVIQNPLFKNL